MHLRRADVSSRWNAISGRTGPSLKPLIWVGSSRNDLREFPEPVKDHRGYALYVAQRGGKHRDTKTVSGFGGAGFWR